MTSKQPTQPKVSVITVCFNAAATIEQTINSVSAQSYQNVEYIIIDGGSQDGTLDIIKVYAQKGIVMQWSSEPDKGISDAFNKGVDKATGDFIQIVNADDWLYPNQIETAVSALLDSPDYGYAYGDLHLYDEGGEHVQTNKGQPNEAKKILPSMVHMPHSTFVVRKEAYQKVGGFNPVVKVSMDYDWVFRANQLNCDGLYVPGLTGVMRIGGVSQRNKLILHMENMICITKYRLWLSPLAIALYLGRVIWNVLKRLLLNSRL